MNPRTLAAVAVLAGLLAGVWVGSTCERAANRRRRASGPDVGKVVERLTKKLDLDAAQAAQVRAALESRRARFEDLRRDSDGRFRALRAEVDRDIESVLTDAQKPRFAELRSKWEKKHAR